MSITPPEPFQPTIEHLEIFCEELLHLLRTSRGGELSPVMRAAMLTGLRVKKETVGEIAGAATVMRELAARVSVADADNLVDIVGTGGDGSNTFNISTASMFVRSEEHTSELQSLMRISYAAFFLNQKRSALNRRTDLLTQMHYISNSNIGRVHVVTTH